MTKWITLLVVVIVGIGLIWWQPWHARTSSHPTNVAATPTPLPACGVTAAAGVTADEDIHLSQPWPDAKLKVGQTVRWVNDTNSTYTLQTIAAEGDACPGFATVTLKPGQQQQLTFLRAGSWSFSAGEVGGVITVR